MPRALACRLGDELLDPCWRIAAYEAERLDIKYYWDTLHPDERPQPHGARQAAEAERLAAAKQLQLQQEEARRHRQREGAQAAGGAKAVKARRKVTARRKEPAPPGAQLVAEGQEPAVENAEG